MSLPSLFFWKMDSHNSQKVAFKRIFSHSTTYMCRPACPKWEYFVSLLSRILNASDGEEKVFWLVERILWCARCTSETRTRVPLHSTPLPVHSSTSSTCTSCSPPTGRRSPPRSRENSEKNSDLLPFVIWTLVCLSPSDRSSVTLRDISREP